MSLDPAASSLTPAALQRHLRSAVFGHRIVYYPTIGSTNDCALDLAAAGEPEGVIVLAEEQTSGRGRRDRTWSSQPRMGIYVSLILRPEVPAPRAPLFTFTAAVAVATALRDTCRVQAGIKWPNDVVVGRRKIAGILAESRGSSPRIRDMVMGIGVNVNQAPGDFGALEERATSARIELGAAVDRAPVLAAILEGFERRYGAVLRGQAGDLLKEWESMSAIPRGRRVTVDGPSGRCEGTVAGVDEEGALLLDGTAEGPPLRVPFGEIVQSFWS